jgi:hypothetical protein
MGDSAQCLLHAGAVTLSQQQQQQGKCAPCMPLECYVTTCCIGRATCAVLLLLQASRPGGVAAENAAGRTAASAATVDMLESASICQQRLRVQSMSRHAVVAAGYLHVYVLQAASCCIGFLVCMQHHRLL